MSDTQFGRALYKYVGTWAARPITGTGADDNVIVGNKAIFTDIQSVGEWQGAEWVITGMLGSSKISTPGDFYGLKSAIEHPGTGSDAEVVYPLPAGIEGVVAGFIAADATLAAGSNLLHLAFNNDVFSDSSLAGMRYTLGVGDWQSIPFSGDNRPTQVMVRTSAPTDRLAVIYPVEQLT